MNQIQKSRKEINILLMALFASFMVCSVAIFYTSVAYAQTTEDPAAAVSALVISVSTLIGTIGVIAGLARTILKRIAGERATTDSTLGKLIAGLGEASQSLEATDKGIKDNLDVVGLVLGSVLRNPKIKETLGDVETQNLLNSIQKEIDEWNEDLQKYYDTIDPKLEGDETPQEIRIAKIRARLVPN